MTDSFGARRVLISPHGSSPAPSCSLCFLAWDSRGRRVLVFFNVFDRTVVSLAEVVSRLRAFKFFKFPSGRRSTERDQAGGSTPGRSGFNGEGLGMAAEGRSEEPEPIKFFKFPRKEN